jgi:hypothetical protein
MEREIDIVELLFGVDPFWVAGAFCSGLHGEADGQEVNGR